MASVATRMVLVAKRAHEQTYMAVRHETAKRCRVLIPTKWNRGMTTGMTALWQAAPPKRYPNTNICLARGHMAGCMVLNW